MLIELSGARKTHYADNLLLFNFQYTPFTLECYIKNAGQNMVMWLKDGSSLESNSKFALSRCGAANIVTMVIVVTMSIKF